MGCMKRGRGRMNDSIPIAGTRLKNTKGWESSGSREGKRKNKKLSVLHDASSIWAGISVQLTPTRLTIRGRMS